VCNVFAIATTLSQLSQFQRMKDDFFYIFFTIFPQKFDELLLAIHIKQLTFSPCVSLFTKQIQLN
jgi:hypothetical protein